MLPKCAVASAEFGIPIVNDSKAKEEAMAKSDGYGIRISCTVACLAAILALAAEQASAQASATTLAKTPSPELVGMLTKGLGVTPEQATGGAGALFGLAKSRLKPEEFGQVAAVVPGMDGLLKDAPNPGGASALGSIWAH